MIVYRLLCSCCVKWPISFLCINTAHHLIHHVAKIAGIPPLKKSENFSTIPSLSSMLSSISDSNLYCYNESSSWSISWLLESCLGTFPDLSTTSCVAPQLSNVFTQSTLLLPAATCKAVKKEMWGKHKISWTVGIKQHTKQLQLI